LRTDKKKPGIKVVKESLHEYVCGSTFKVDLKEILKQIMKTKTSNVNWQVIFILSNICFLLRIIF
jgi:hypothetical protein